MILEKSVSAVNFATLIPGQWLNRQLNKILSVLVTASKLFKHCNNSHKNCMVQFEGKISENRSSVKFWKRKIEKVFQSGDWQANAFVLFLYFGFSGLKKVEIWSWNVRENSGISDSKYAIKTLNMFKD